MTRVQARAPRPWPALLLGLAALTGCTPTVDVGQLSTADPDTSTSDTLDATDTTTPTSTGASTTASTDTPVTVKITETAVTLPPGGWRGFSATVENASDSYVTWSLDPPANSGVFVEQGSPRTVRYDAPATPGTYHLIATSDEDPTASVAATITVSASAPTTATIFTNYNPDSVGSDPTADTTFVVTETRHITYIDTYHYLIGNTPVGTISLRHSDNTLYGPWQAMGLYGGGIINGLWVCYPNVDIKPGTYTIVDSSPSTWSTNGGSGNQGFAQVDALALP